MVQRKVPSKLGIVQADHIMVNSKPLLATLKPSSLQQQQQQQQDVKSSRGAEVKKKMMKKSGKTAKHSEFENLRSPTVRRSSAAAATTTPQRSCPIKGSSSSTPNYMKSTSSSDARKEQSQVSSRSPQSVSSKSSGRKSSNASKSGHNPARALARTTSLRALTKAPSFKPARASSKKCSQVVLCEDLDVQRATCSSTLKDSKFPCYLELNPGGTESQGTSAMKVCPYTYCSLNGHHHLPLPSLKCFLSARRRAVKAQWSLKIGCLSPRRARPSGLTLAGDGPSQQEVISSPRAEENMEFTIEIYCKERAGEVQENRDSSAEEGEDIHPASMAAQEESGFDECLSEDDHGSVTESMANQPDSEDSDMEYAALYIDAGVIDLITHNEEKTDLDEVYGSDKKSCYDVIQDESTLKAKDNDETGCIIDEVLAENMLEKSFDEESMTSGAWLSDDDTQSSISCADESDFCEYVEESTGCNENGITQMLLQVSDVQTEEEICRDCSVSQEENMIPPEDDVTALTGFQESDDSNDFISTENNGSESDQASADEGLRAQLSQEEPETSDEGSQNPQLNDCVQEDYNAEKELMDDVKTQKTAKVITKTSENQNADLELPSLRRTARDKRETEEEELREFNPRGPNFLPLEPDPEAERVGLKHQSMDERKNAEEWMVDYALRQAVSKLAPARQKKVALLVEAFETVSPIPKYESHLRHSSTKLFPPTRSIQACS